MSKFGFADFITLAKSGWTPEAFNAALDRIESMNQEAEEESHDNEEESQESEDNSSEDGAAALEEKDARIKELEEQLKAAQAHNRQQDNSGGEHKTLDDEVDDIFNEFFN